MQIVQLFVDGEQVDMFKDESITISDSIANIKDISKIYTAYSRQFTLPASPTNNRIFKHYYNYNIVNNVFDARYKTDAYLNVNGIRYKDGKLRLSGVKLKDNSPESYQVTFFGNAVALKDLFGEDNLAMLVGGTEGLNTYNHTYNNLTVRKSFNNSQQLFAGTPRAGDIKYSFISHSRPFRYDGVDVISDYDGETGLDTYLGLSDLKPSLRLKSIVKAIEEKYSITFSQDFFNTTYFKNLYMWLHKEAGEMKQYSENLLTTYLSDTSTWALTSGTDFRTADGGLFAFNSPYGEFPFTRYIVQTYKVNISGLSAYDVQITDNGSLLYNSSATGTNTFSTDLYLDGQAQTYFLDFRITSTAAISPTQQVTIKRQTKINYSDTWTDDGTATYTASAIAVSGYLDIPSQMPNMKVYDFVINLFKMHQLTASIDKELNGDETVNVLPLQDYYSTGETHDITKNIDVSSAQVDRLIPYKEINFTYKGRKSAAIMAYDQAFPNNKFGDLNWTAGTEDMDGQAYNVGLDFEHMYFERILSSGGTESTVQYGVMIDQDLNPIVGMPLIHSIVLRSTPTPNLKWNNGDSTQATLTDFNAPTNIDANNNSIHWGAEQNEYTEVLEQQSLYNRYYFDSITSVFAQNARKVTYKSYLPLGLLLSYNLNDRFRIGYNTFKIESVNTNLLNQESTLVLYNDLPPSANPADTEDIIIDPSKPEPVITQLPTPCDRKLVWNYMDGVNGYLVYLNGVSLTKLNQDTPFYEYTTIDFESSNTVGVQALYGSNDEFGSRVVREATQGYDLFYYLNELEDRASYYENECESFNLLTELNRC
jgi:hypothetical protein